MTLNGRQMMTFGVWRWNEAKGGMRCAFPPYGPASLSQNSDSREQVYPVHGARGQHRRDA